MLGHAATDEMRENRDRSGGHHIRDDGRARERVIYRRDSHIKHILEKMCEPV